MKKSNKKQEPKTFEGLNEDEQEFAIAANEAFASASFIFFKYVVPADPEDPESKEHITERWVLPLTTILYGPNCVYFKAWCHHAWVEKKARKEYEKALPKDSKEVRYAHKMTCERIFRVDRIEEWSPDTHKLAPTKLDGEPNEIFDLILMSRPDVAARAGYKRVWEKVTNTATGEITNKLVIVAKEA